MLFRLNQLYRVFLLGVFSIIFFFAGYSQKFDSKKDSLSHILENSDNRDECLNAALFLGRMYNNSYLEKELAVIYYKKALEYETDSFQRGMLLDSLGLFSWQLGEFNNALDFFKRSLVYFEQLNDSLWLGRVINNIAVVNYGQGNRNQALIFYQRALKIREAINDKLGVTRILNNIGMIYQDWGLYDDALKWHSDALEISIEINEPTALAYSYSNVGECYQNLDNYDEALNNYYKGYRELLAEDKNNRSNSFFSANIGSIYSKTNQLDSALFHYRRALGYAHRINNQNRIAIAEYLLGNTFLKINSIDSAVLYANKSYKTAVKQDYPDLIKDNLFLLAEIEEKKGNPVKSLDILKKAVQIKDSIFNNHELLKFTQLQIEYDKERRENENLLLERNKNQSEIIKKQRKYNQVLIFAGLIVLVVLIVVLRSRISLKKLSKKLESSERQLQQANADKDRFFAIIAHDLRGPFNGLLGLTELLNDQFDKLSKDKTQYFIQSIHESAKTVFSLLEGLLQWALIQTGKMKFNISKVDLNTISQRILDLFVMDAAKKQIVLKNNVPQNSWVLADEMATEVILRNIVSNALKFSNSGSEVLLESNFDNPYLQVRIIDSGIGMSKEIRDNLFRIDNKLTRVGTNSEKGSGLGLILCKEMVEKQNGKIEVESTEGQGSTFVVSFIKA